MGVGENVCSGTPMEVRDATRCSIRARARSEDGLSE